MKLSILKKSAPTPTAKTTAKTEPGKFRALQPSDKPLSKTCDYWQDIECVLDKKPDRFAVTMCSKNEDGTTRTRRVMVKGNRVMFKHKYDPAWSKIKAFLYAHVESKADQQGPGKQQYSLTEESSGYRMTVVDPLKDRPNLRGPAITPASPKEFWLVVQDKLRAMHVTAAKVRVATVSVSRPVKAVKPAGKPPVKKGAAKKPFKFTFSKG